MTSETLKAGGVSEVSVRKALTVTKGDIFLTAAYLDCSVREVEWFIRRSDELLAYAVSIEKVKKNPDFDRMTNDQFADELDRRNREYRLEATNIIHEVATLPIHDGDGKIREEMTAAMVEVKLKAAIQLRGGQNESRSGGDQMAVLAELNQLYQQSAPRIKSIRAVQIEYQAEDTQGQHQLNPAS